MSMLRYVVWCGMVVLMCVYMYVLACTMVFQSGSCMCVTVCVLGCVLGCVMVLWGGSCGVC